MNGIVRVPAPVNEPVLSYAPGSPERAALKRRLAEMANTQIEIPLVIGGQAVRTGKTGRCVSPHDHGRTLATYHQAGRREVEQAIAAAATAWREWSETPWEARAAVLLKAADLLAGPWRDTVNAAPSLQVIHPNSAGRRWLVRRSQLRSLKLTANAAASFFPSAPQIQNPVLP